MTLEVLDVEPFGRDALLGALRNTRLQGFDRAQPYRDATLTLETVAPDDLAPAQRYVLLPGAAKILRLRSALLEHGIDMFVLDGGAYVKASDAPVERIPVIPPVVEESHEPDGRTVLVINDGIHRVYAARSLGLPIRVVVARGVPPEFPYYAYALERGWEDVAGLEALPEGFQKKSYRFPGNHRSLFRDFNEQFPGVQKVRRARGATSVPR